MLHHLAGATIQVAKLSQLKMSSLKRIAIINILPKSKCRASQTLWHDHKPYQFGYSEVKMRFFTLQAKYREPSPLKFCERSDLTATSLLYTCDGE